MAFHPFSELAKGNYTCGVYSNSWIHLSYSICRRPSSTAFLRYWRGLLLNTPEKAIPPPDADTGNPRLPPPPTSWLSIMQISMIPLGIKWLGRVRSFFGEVLAWVPIHSRPFFSLGSDKSWLIIASCCRVSKPVPVEDGDWFLGVDVPDRLCN